MSLLPHRAFMAGYRANFTFYILSVGATQRKGGDESKALNIAFGMCVFIWRAPCQNFEVSFQLEFLIAGLFDSLVREVQYNFHHSSQKTAG